MFYRKLFKDIEDYGFKINTDDPCVTKNSEWKTFDRHMAWSLGDIIKNNL